MSIKSNLIWPVIILGFWGWVITPSKVMGTLNPVVTNIQITSEQDIDDSEWVFVSGTFLKLREACRPLRMEWVLGTRLKPGPPVEYVWGKPEVRFSGEQVFEDWHVRAAPPAIFNEETFADVIHKCAIVIGDQRIEFPWETRTAFWN